MFPTKTMVLSPSLPLWLLHSFILTARLSPFHQHHSFVDSPNKPRSPLPLFLQYCSFPALWLAVTFWGLFSHCSSNVTTKGSSWLSHLIYFLHSTFNKLIFLFSIYLLLQEKVELVRSIRTGIGEPQHLQETTLGATQRTSTERMSQNSTTKHWWRNWIFYVQLQIIFWA